MRIFITGATGVIGRAALPHLVQAGHSVTAVHRSADGKHFLEHHGARAAVVDLFDPAAVNEAVADADAVIHLATAIPPMAKMTRTRHWAVNDRLRTDATRNLVDGSIAASVGSLIVESITFNYVDGGSDWIDEDHPVDPPFRATASALIAESEVARFAATGRRGVALRMSQLYGPGRASDELLDRLRDRKVPLVGTGGNYVSNLHADDAGTAVAAALAVDSGCYNVSDDEPLTTADRLAVQVESIGAPAPRRVPVRLARILVGPATNLLTVSQRVLNRRFVEAAGWKPRYPSIRDGWPTATGGGDPVERFRP